jgi:hypothetical protein
VALVPERKDLIGPPISPPLMRPAMRPHELSRGPHASAARPVGYFFLSTVSTALFLCARQGYSGPSSAKETYSRAGDLQPRLPIAQVLEAILRRPSTSPR